MSTGGRPVGKVTVSRMKPLSSRSHSEHSGIKQSVFSYIATLCDSNDSSLSHLLVTHVKESYVEQTFE